MDTHKSLGKLKDNLSKKIVLKKREIYTLKHCLYKNENVFLSLAMLAQLSYIINNDIIINIVFLFGNSYTIQTLVHPSRTENSWARCPIVNLVVSLPVNAKNKVVRYIVIVSLILKHKNTCRFVIKILAFASIKDDNKHNIINWQS